MRYTPLFILFLVFAPCTIPVHSIHANEDDPVPSTPSSKTAFVEPVTPPIIGATVTRTPTPVLKKSTELVTPSPSPQIKRSSSKSCFREAMIRATAAQAADDKVTSPSRPMPTSRSCSREAMDSMASCVPTVVHAAAAILKRSGDSTYPSYAESLYYEWPSQSSPVTYINHHETRAPERTASPRPRTPSYYHFPQH